MGMHATIHGKNTTPANGASGTWQPIEVNSAGQLVIAPLAGELSQFNRLAAGPIAKYAVVTADTVVTAAPAILYGVVLIAAGTMANIYDNASAASGNVLIPSTTATVTFSGIGVLCTNGIYADWTSGTWLVLYADAV
jgi:hypothetical protein